VQEFNRKLPDKEIEEIIEKVGDYIAWYNAIDYAFQSVLE